MDVFPPIIFEDAIRSPRVIFTCDRGGRVGAGGTIEDEFCGSCGGDGTGGYGGSYWMILGGFNDGGFDAHLEGC